VLAQLGPTMEISRHGIEVAREYVETVK
jgi:hypothetical protein